MAIIDEKLSIFCMYGHMKVKKAVYAVVNPGPESETLLDA